MNPGREAFIQEMSKSVCMDLELVPGECCRLLYLMFEAEAIQFLQAMPFFSISLFLLCLFPSAS